MKNPIKLSDNKLSMVYKRDNCTTVATLMRVNNRG